MAIIKISEDYNFDNGRLKSNAGDWVEGIIQFKQRSVIASNIRNVCTHTTPMSGVDQFTFNNFDWSINGYSVGDVLSCSVAYTIDSEVLSSGIWAIDPTPVIGDITFDVEIATITGSEITLTSAPFNVIPIGLDFTTTLGNPTAMPGTVLITSTSATTRDVMTYGNVSLINTSRPDEIDFQFNLARNGTTTQESVIDGEVNRFSFQGLLPLSVGVVTPLSQHTNKSGGFFDGVTIEKIAENIDFSTLFEIKFTFFDWGIIEDGFLEPTYYAATDQLVPVSTITTTTSTGGTDVLESTTASLDDTGGFDEVYNGRENTLTVMSTNWFDSAGNQISSLDFSEVSTFKSVIDTVTAQTASHRFRIGLVWRPEDSNFYKNKTTDLGDNLIVNAPTFNYGPSITASSNIHLGKSNVNGARWDISDMMFRVVGTTLEVTGKVTPNAACTALFSTIPDGGRKSTLWVSMGRTPFTDGVPVVPQKDRVSLKLWDKDNIDVPKIGKEIPDVIEEKLLDHADNDISSSFTPNTTTEDDVLYKSAFLLPDNVLYDGLRATISAYNTISGAEFELENNYIDFSTVVNIAGQYQPNIVQQRSFNLPPSSNRNHYSIKRKPSLDVAGKYGIEFEYGFLNDWRYWINQPNVDNAFYSPSPNPSPIPPFTELVDDFNGKNKNWQEFYNGDWELRISYFLSSGGVEDFHHKEFKIRPYEDDIDITMTEEIILLSSGSVLSTLAANKVQMVTATFTWNQDFDTEWVEITIEDFEGGNRWVMSSLLNQGNITTNPLKPLIGNNTITVTGSGTNTLTCRALVDTNNVNASKVAMSYRVFSMPNESAPFIMTIDTTEVGSPNNTFILLLNNGVTDSAINWGDGTSDVITSHNQSELTHVYSEQGNYTVTIDGQIAGIRFNSFGDTKKVTSIEQWGSNGWESFDSAFYGCENMVANYIDFPNLTNVDNLFQAFRGCTSYNGALTGWDTSNVINFGAFFFGCSSFNQPVSGLNTSSAIAMGTMFFDCSSFNQPITFNTSTVTTFTSFLHNATSFNSDIIIDTSSSLSMLNFLSGCSSFNRPLNLNTSLVTVMQSMFSGCTSFNSSLVLDTSSASSMINMFFGCTAFNQNISSFNMSSLIIASNFLFGTSLSTGNYDLLLVSIEGNPHNNNVTFHGGNATYTLGSAADTARAALIANGWVITDGGGI